MFSLFNKLFSLLNISENKVVEKRKTQEVDHHHIHLSFENVYENKGYLPKTSRLSKSNTSRVARSQSQEFPSPKLSLSRESSSRTKYSDDNNESGII